MPSILDTPQIDPTARVLARVVALEQRVDNLQRKRFLDFDAFSVTLPTAGAENLYNFKWLGGDVVFVIGGYGRGPTAGVKWGYYITINGGVIAGTLEGVGNVEGPGNAGVYRIGAVAFDPSLATQQLELHPSGSFPPSEGHVYGAIVQWPQ